MHPVTKDYSHKPHHAGESTAFDDWDWLQSNKGGAMRPLKTIHGGAFKCLAF